MNTPTLAYYPAMYGRSWQRTPRERRAKGKGPLIEMMMFNFNETLARVSSVVRPSFAASSVWSWTVQRVVCFDLIKESVGCQRHAVPVEPNNKTGCLQENAVTTGPAALCMACASDSVLPMHGTSSSLHQNSEAKIT